MVWVQTDLEDDHHTELERLKLDLRTRRGRKVKMSEAVEFAIRRGLDAEGYTDEQAEDIETSADRAIARGN